MPHEFKESENAELGVYKAGVEGRMTLKKNSLLSNVANMEEQSDAGSITKASAMGVSKHSDDTGSQNASTVNKSAAKSDTKKSKKGKKGGKDKKKAKDEPEEPKELTEEEKEELRLQAVYEERLRRDISNLYPEPSTKIFLDAVNSKLKGLDHSKSNKKINYKLNE